MFKSQPNGDYEVQKESCYFRPTVSFEIWEIFLFVPQQLINIKKTPRKKYQCMLEAFGILAYDLGTYST